MEKCSERKQILAVFRYLGEYLEALFGLMMKILKEKCRLLFNSGGCFGCCTRPSCAISVRKRSKRLKNCGQTKRSLGEEFWSSSAGEMDNRTVPSQRSISSSSISNRTTNNHSEFVNHGFLLWNEIRQQWVRNTGSQKRTPFDESKISFDATYDNLLGTNERFPHPIPLSEMIDFLVNAWEHEGLYG